MRASEKAIQGVALCLGLLFGAALAVFFITLAAFNKLLNNVPPRG